MGRQRKNPLAETKPKKPKVEKPKVEKIKDDLVDVIETPTIVIPVVIEEIEIPEISEFPATYTIENKTRVAIPFPINGLIVQKFSAIEVVIDNQRTFDRCKSICEQLGRMNKGQINMLKKDLE